MVRFFKQQAKRKLTEDNCVTCLRLLEMQRHAMFMFTSCGWFFDELSGIETVQVLQYAGRVIQLAQSVLDTDLEPPFLERLAKAPSNIREHRDGRRVYEKFVKPTLVDREHLGAHFAVSSLFESYPDKTRKADMDSLVRSKAAMYTILETITGTMGMALAELETFYVAGTFGSLIDPKSAITIGMIPDLPLERYQSLGNSSLGGATLALISRSLPNEMEDLRNRITYLELNVNQDFMNRFSAAKFIPHTDKTRFPSVMAGISRIGSEK